MKFDQKALRSAFGTFMTGVTVVTTIDEAGTPRGFTANSFTSVSLDPPLLAICIANTAHSADVFRSADGFAVNILSDQQVETSNLFASKRPDKFSVAPWQQGSAGHPVLDGVLTWFDCTSESIVEAGDHFILIGRVRGFESGEQNPLGFARGGYFTLDGERRMAAITSRQADVGVGVSAIVARDECIWLIPDSTGRATLPRQVLGRGETVLDGIQAMLTRKGCAAELGFLFAVYDREDGPGQEIVYRAQASVPEPALGEFLPFDEALKAVSHDATLSRMLARYCTEHTTRGFGVYVGPAQGGQVEPLARDYAG